MNKKNALKNIAKADVFIFYEENRYSFEISSISCMSFG